MSAQRPLSGNPGADMAPEPLLAKRTLGRSDRTDCLPILARRKVLGSARR